MKRQRQSLDGALNTRVINFADSNNHLTGLLVDYLSHSLGLPDDPEGTNTVIGLLKAALGDFIVLAGLKDWLNVQWSEGLIQNPYQKDFNQWCLDHINTQDGEIDTIDSTLNTIDKWMNRIEKVVGLISKAVRIIMSILNIFGFVEIPQGATPQYTYNPNFDTTDVDELEEFINALEEIVTNGWFKSRSYTKAEIDAILNDYLTKSEASTNYYTKIQVDAYLTTLATQKADSSSVYTKSETNTLLAAKADVSNTYTKTETDTLLSAKANVSNTYTKTETDSLLSNKANSSSLTSYYTKTETDTLLLNSYVSKQHLYYGNITIHFAYFSANGGTFTQDYITAPGYAFRFYSTSPTSCILNAANIHFPISQGNDRSFYIGSISFDGEHYRPTAAIKSEIIGVYNNSGGTTAANWPCYLSTSSYTDYYQLKYYIYSDNTHTTQFLITNWYFTFNNFYLELINS